MKVLLLAHAFAPYNASGSVRAVKLAEHLMASGHEVRVLTGRPHAYPATLTTTVPPDCITATPWRRVEAPLDLARARLAGKVVRSAPAPATGGGTPARRSLAERAVVAYRSLVSFPDPQAGWIGPATRSGLELVATWRPDLVYSTALPFSSHVVAARLARAAGCPWVGEYRDLYSGNPYSELWRVRAGLDRAFERRIMASASAVVSVSPGMTDYLASLTGKPAATVLNGFDPADFARAPDVSADLDADKVTILYTGIIYPGRRDPAVLLEALRRLGEKRHGFEVRFYGPALEPVAAAAEAKGVGDCVRTFAPVPYLTSLGLQKAADVLLLLLWDSPEERFVLTGKLFEYVGAGRPILSLGCLDGAAAGLVRERGLGLASTDPDEVAAYLLETARLKRQPEAGRAAGNAAATGLSRREQFIALERFLAGHGLLREADAPAAAAAAGQTPTRTN